MSQLLSSARTTFLKNKKVVQKEKEILQLCRAKYRVLYVRFISSVCSKFFFLGFK